MIGLKIYLPVFKDSQRSVSIENSYLWRIDFCFVLLCQRAGVEIHTWQTQPSLVTSISGDLCYSWLLGSWLQAQSHLFSRSIPLTWLSLSFTYFNVPSHVYLHIFKRAGWLFLVFFIKLKIVEEFSELKL